MATRIVELKLKLKIKDDVFAHKLESIIKESLVDIDFNVEKFAQAMSLSRSQLYRKLKKETGLSCSEFIRQKRIEIACELLGSTDLKISKISEYIGFKDDSYFTRRFREVIGITPTEYREGKKK